MPSTVSTGRCGQQQLPGSKLEQGPGEGEGGGFLGRENSFSLLVGCWGAGLGVDCQEACVGTWRVGSRLVMWVGPIHIKFASCAEIAKFQSGSTEVSGFRNKGIKLAFLEKSCWLPPEG